LVSEIPLIAKVREKLYGEHLENNTGSIYGIDYIGAGVGAALWVTFMLAIDPYRAAITHRLCQYCCRLVVPRTIQKAHPFQPTATRSARHCGRRYHHHRKSRVELG